MEKPVKKVKVRTSNYVPNTVPFEVTQEDIDKIVSNSYDNLGKFIHVGWIKRKRFSTDSKKSIMFLIATSDKKIEARKLFKYSENYGKDLWEISKK